jgi:hypothetical protein
MENENPGNDWETGKPIPSEELMEESLVAAIKDQVSCDLSDGSVVLSLREGIYYGLNPVGSRIWGLLQEPKTLGEIQRILLEEYEVEPERCLAEIRTFLKEMMDKDLIEVRDGKAS